MILMSKDRLAQLLAEKLPKSRVEQSGLRRGGYDYYVIAPIAESPAIQWYIEIYDHIGDGQFDHGCPMIGASTGIIAPTRSPIEVGGRRNIPPGYSTSAILGIVMREFRALVENPWEAIHCLTMDSEISAANLFIRARLEATSSKEQYMDLFERAAIQRAYRNIAPGIAYATDKLGITIESLKAIEQRIFTSIRAAAALL